MTSPPYQKKFKYKNKVTRGLFFLFGDTMALTFSAWATFIILSPFTSPMRAFPTELVLLIIAAVLIALGVFHMYQVNWRYVSLRDLLRIIGGISVGGGCALGIAHFLLAMRDYENVFTLLMVINSVLTISAFRISKRMYFVLFKSSQKDKKHTIIFGGESEGEQILRDILRNDQWKLSVHGIFDDRMIPGILLHGVRILGGQDKMIEYIKAYPVDQLIVAYPEFPKKDLKEIIAAIKSIRPEMDIKVLPSFHTLSDDPVGIKHIRDISIEDILGREAVKIDMNSIKASIAGKTVLVTGGGGSIGGELVRQCANLEPAKLIALDIDETELFHIEHDLKNLDTKVIPCVASITDKNKVDRVLAKYKPDVIFHAAAYKHVPMMESFPGEAIKVNVGGTQTIALLASKHRVDKFVMVSTDKAVNPTNVMGATKRIAEEICMGLNDTSVTKFISVRFGNVLGSRGSVVPLFIEQIKNGGPVTITDPQMKRYFMTIPEAVLLVMQAGSMGEGGEVFVLDMGKPVKIIEMARDLIKLHGVEPDKDIQIVVTGRRPGEKLFEELLNAEEGVMETEHQEIFKAICSKRLTAEELKIRIGQLFDLLKKGEVDSIRDVLQSIVPTYSYQQKAEPKSKVKLQT